MLVLTTAIKVVLGLFFTYIFSSLVIFLIFCMWLKTSKEKILETFFFTLGLGPITISWILTWILRFFPNHSNTFYLTVIILLFILFFISCYQKWNFLKYLIQQIKLFIKKLSWGKFELIITLFVFLNISLILINATVLPLSEKDALQYAFVARLIYIKKIVNFYPVIHPDPQTGFYATSSHPLGYICLEFWNYLLQGNSQHPGLIKLISPFYAFCTALVIWFLLARRKNIYGLLAAFLIGITPNYFIQSSICGIDAFRIHMFFLAFVWLIKLVEEENKKIATLVGAVSGLSMYSHSIGGIFTIPFLAFAYFLFSKQKKSQKLLNLSIIIIIALSIGGYRYIANYFIYGTPIYDNLPVYEIPKLGHKEYIRYAHNIVCLDQRILNGVLAGWRNIKMFSFSYWFFLIAILGWKRIVSSSEKTKAQIFIIPIFLYYLCLSLSLFLDLDVFIGNYRYYLTVQPFIAYFGALTLGRVYEKLVRQI